jgi:hypothetical protein
MNDAIAYRIANASAALGIPVQITHAWQVGAVACYALAFSPRITIREIKARQDDLARLVGTSITISQDETTGMVIAQARAPRRQRLLAGPNAPKLSGLRIAIGRFTSGQGDAVLDFTSPAHAHLLLVAATGGGKTEAIHTILYQIARQNPPAQATMLLIDPAGNRIHEAWDGSAHLAAPVVRADLAAALRALEWAADLVRQRNAERRNSPRLLVVVDEMASLFFARDDLAARARNALAAITQLGRVAGVHAVLATQYASRETLGSPFIRANLRARLVGRVDSAQASAIACGRDGCDAHRLLGHGDFLLIDDTGARRLQVALTRPEHIAALKRAPAPLRAAFLPASPRQPEKLTPPPLEDELLEKMRALLAADPEASNRKIELALFGYTGGSATTTVKRLRERLCAA